MVLAKDLDDVLTGQFNDGACSSVCCKLDCCLYCLCPALAICYQRKRILNITGEPYICCGGTFPFCGFDKPCNEVCLIGEVLCCSLSASAANRFYVQTRFNKKNTGCDDCLRIFHCCLTIECAIARCCCNVAKEKEYLCKAGAVTHPCGHCQQEQELKSIQRTPYTAPPVAVIGLLPKHFSNAGIQLAEAPRQLLIPH